MTAEAPERRSQRQRNSIFFTTKMFAWIQWMLKLL